MATAAKGERSLRPAPCQRCGKPFRTQAGADWHRDQNKDCVRWRNDDRRLTMQCRVCDRYSFPFNEDNSINHDHDLCDEIIAEFAHPRVVPPGVSYRDFRQMTDDEIRAEYKRRTIGA